jgi:hypothetical protein
VGRLKIVDVLEVAQTPRRQIAEQINLGLFCGDPVHQFVHARLQPGIQDKRPTMLRAVSSRIALQWVNREKAGAPP